MNAFRQCAALLLTVVMPPFLLYWLAIHPFVRFWRRLGLGLSLGIVWGIVLLAAAGLFRFRGWLLAVDYGTNWICIGVGLVCLATAGWLRRRLKQHFSARALVGLPELAPERHHQPLVTEGLHAIVRHPRYLQFLLALLGWSLLANHLAAYVASALWIPGVWLIVLLEEKELRQRYGPEYEAYCRRVPRFLPRWGRRS
jgi:protein-S-isoprenylcysteine O-methyltransferase Ste14